MIKRTFFLILIGVFLSTSIYALDVNAGMDKEACANEVLTLGGMPTAENGLAPYTYNWTSTNGFTSSEANPEYLLPPTPAPHTITFTVEVTDADGFKCSDEVVITVVELKEVTFSEDFLPADGTSTVTAMVMTVPTGRTVTWSIEGTNLGCTINSTTGVVTAGMTSGTIKVRATDMQLTDCHVEAELCVNAMECCDADGSRTFGPITVSIPNLTSNMVTSDGYCVYEADLGVSLSMIGDFARTETIAGVTVKWEEKISGSTILYKNVTMKWTGSIDVAKFGVIDAKVTDIDLTINSDGKLAGNLMFTVNQTTDVNVGGIAVLKAGTNGTIKYSYVLSQAGFGGTWDLSSIMNFKVDLKKGSQVIATMTAGSISTDGTVQNAKLSATAPVATYTTNSFTAILEQLDLGFDYHLKNNQINFTSGTGKVRVKNVPNIQGEFVLGLTYTGGGFTVAVTLENVKAFGCDITGTMEAGFDNSFDFQQLSGNSISAKHTDFDQSFSGVGFKIENGDLKDFSIGQITVKYKQGIEFSMTNANYSSTESRLIFDAKVVLPSLQLDVEQFKIDMMGNISISKIEGEINAPPVKLGINATFATDRFSGMFNGQFTGNIGINGSILVGSNPNPKFNYGHFTLGVTVPGIPIGNSGLKIKSLAGEFGYNYAASTMKGGTGVVQQGATSIGFGLGIADIADLVLVEGYVKLVLGNATSMGLNGAVKVRATAPHYVQGNVNVSYTLGSGSVDGSFSSQIKFPPSSGNIINLNSGNINFGIASNKRFYVSGSGLNGKIFNTVDVTGGISFGAPLNNTGNIVGRVHGSVAYSNMFTYAYPSGFDPSNCTTAKATDTFFGFGIKGNLNVNLGGNINATINASGINGAVSVSVSGNSTIKVSWPCILPYCCSLSTYTVSANGMVTLEKSGSNTRLHGMLTFISGGESETGMIDFNL